MTTRPGQQALDLLNLCVGACYANLIEIRRTDGLILRFTDHDRALTDVHGDVYVPARAVGLSAERREAAFRGGDQEIYGLIDGQNVVIADLSGHLYRGARINHYIVDWRYPWNVFSFARKVITNIRFTETTWVATAMTLTASMNQPKGGRFRGISTPNCLYQFGNLTTCKKDITSLINTGVRVQSILTQRTKIRTVGTTWRASYAENFFRDGDFEFRWQAPAVTGTSTSPTTVNGTTFADTTKSWTTNQFVGYVVRILNAANGYVLAYRTISGNTGNTLNVYQGWDAVYASGVNYDICAPSVMAGVLLPIHSYANTNRDIELFFPSPLNIAVGDSGIVRPGCDGQFGTCRDTHNNAINFGGMDLYAPTATDVIKTPEDI